MYQYVIEKVEINPSILQANQKFLENGGGLEGWSDFYRLLRTEPIKKQNKKKTRITLRSKWCFYFIEKARNVLFLDYRMFLILDYDWDCLFPETRTFLVLDEERGGREPL